MAVNRRRRAKINRYIDRLMDYDPGGTHIKITASMWAAMYGLPSGKAWRRQEEHNRRYPTVFFGDPSLFIEAGMDRQE